MRYHRATIPETAYPLRITCPTCKAAFNVPDGAIKAKGRKMRCSKCAHEWHQMPVEEEDEPAVEAVKAKPKPKPKAKPKAKPEPPPPADDEAPPEAEDDAGAGDGELRAEDPFERRGPRMIPRGALGRGAPQKSRPMALYVMLALLVLLPSGLVLARDSVVAAGPPAALLYQKVHLPVPVAGEALAIQNVGVWRKTQGSIELMVIKGQVRNHGTDVQTVPLLRGRLTDEGGRQLQDWLFGAEAPTLLPGETTQFYYEVPEPPAAGAKVTFMFSGGESAGGHGY